VSTDVASDRQVGLEVETRQMLALAASGWNVDDL
jgi:hypothetical protein